MDMHDYSRIFKDNFPLHIGPVYQKKKDMGVLVSGS